MGWRAARSVERGQSGWVFWVERGRGGRHSGRSSVWKSMSRRDFPVSVSPGAIRAGPSTGWL